MSKVEINWQICKGLFKQYLEHHGDFREPDHTSRKYIMVSEGDQGRFARMLLGYIEIPQAAL